MPCFYLASTFEGGEHRLRLRMDVALSSGKIAVAGKVCKGVRVHHFSPSREAGVPERVQREFLQVRELAGVFVLFLGLCVAKKEHRFDTLLANAQTAADPV